MSSRRKRTPRKKPPPGFVAWNEATFQRLITSPPETLVSRFRIGHGMVVSLLQRGEEERTPGTGYRLLIDLVNRCYESPAARRLLRRDAARVFRSLRSAGLVRRIRDAESGCAWLRVGSDLQRDFSLHHSLSLYLVDAVSLLDPDQPDYALDVLSLVEAVLENPRPILQQQTNRAKQELVAALKAQGVPYEERIEKLEEVTHPKPNAEFTYRTFNLFAQQHPWLAEENIRPKSVAREMWEGYEDFPDYVRRYGIQRSEGLLLRYLSQVHNTLVQSVPEYAHDDQLADIIGFFRAMLGRVDSSLVEEWESRSRSGEPAAAARPRAPELFDLARHPKLLHARIRAELYQLVRALAMRHYADAADCVRQDPEAVWDAARFEAELEPFYAEYDRIVFEPRARQAHQTLVKAVAPRRWDVHHVLVDERDENLWNVEGEVDLSVDRSPKGPLLRLRRIGT